MSSDDASPALALASWGFDSGRHALKCRCPAAAHDFARQGRATCERMVRGGRLRADTG